MQKARFSLHISLHLSFVYVFLYIYLFNVCAEKERISRKDVFAIDLRMKHAPFL